ncbi:MAG: catalase [Bacillota bacterium]
MKRDLKKVDNSKDVLTTSAGAFVSNNSDTMTAGMHGGAMVSDIWMHEKLAHFDRELIPERRMHAKGSGAFGTFTVTGDITKYTRASIFSKIGKQTPMLARFSLANGEKASADAERDVRGFALKFYTETGNWDLVGNNTPVFFMRDVMRFIDFNHAAHRHPATNLRDNASLWDFWTRTEESFHQITITMSDRGIPMSYRHMHGFSSHAFSFLDKNNNRTYVKFHMECMQGIKNLTDAEASKIIGTDRDSYGRDLFYAIQNANYPKWKMFVQLMTEQQAIDHYEDPFDLTKVWRHKEFPLIEVGIFELNRNPDNYFAQIEQSAFTPSNVIDGIGFSPDKMLQARLFSYPDAHMYRLGVNHNKIPVNMPHCKVNDYHRDGAMRTDDNFKDKVNYQPNSFGKWEDSKNLDYPPLETFGDVARYPHTKPRPDDNYYQAGLLYHIMKEKEKKALIANTARHIADAKENVKYRHCAHCYLADSDYGMRMTTALMLDLPRVVQLSEMTFEDRIKATTPI